MSRLTYKEKWIDEFVNEEHQYQSRSDGCVDKLGRLEDIEEELGCPLEVVFEALSKGIEYEIEISTYHAVGDTIPTKRLAKRKNIQEIKLKKYINKFVFFVPYDYSRSGIVINDIIYLKDYKKTWWLKGDKDA